MKKKSFKGPNPHKYTNDGLAPLTQEDRTIITQTRTILQQAEQIKALEQRNTIRTPDFEELKDISHDGFTFDRNVEIANEINIIQVQGKTIKTLQNKLKTCRDHARILQNRIYLLTGCLVLAISFIATLFIP